MKRIMGLALALMIIATLANAQKPTGYSLKKGDVFTMTQVTKQDVKQEAMGQSIESIQNTENVDEIEVMAVNGNSYTLKVTAMKRSVAMSSPMGSMEMSSDIEGGQNAPMKIMTNKSYMVELSNKGKVSKVSGVEEMKASMKQEFEAANLGANSDQMLVTYTEDLLKTTIETVFSIYNEVEAAEWSNTSATVVNGLPITYENSFKWDNDKTILAEATMTINGSTEAMGQSLSTDMKGDQQTIIDLDVKTGMPMTTQSMQSFEGSIETQGMSIPMTIKSEIKTTIVKK